MAVNLDPLRAQLATESRRRVDTAVSRMTSDLTQTAPVGETGRLRRATGVRVTSQTPQRIVAEAQIDVDYAEVVVQGSRPHVIRPSRAQALRFYWPKRGAVVFFAKVNHPGTEANPFFKNVTSRWADYLRAA